MTGKVNTLVDSATSTKKSQEKCFHCGLPVPDSINLHLDLLEKERSFCCQGCYAVAKAIHDGGMDDFYRHRESPSGRVDAGLLPDFLDNLSLYDRDEIQKEFVSKGADWKEASLILENIRCPACLWLNEQHLRKLPGVLDVQIDYTTERARVRWQPELIALSQILKAITEIGYTAHPYDPAHHERLLEDQKRRSTERLIFSGLTMMLVMNFSIASYIMGGVNEIGKLPLWMIIGRWTSLIVATAVLLYPAQDFFVGAWRDVRNRRAGMDVPIVIGLLTAYIGSISSTIQQQGEVYFDSIVMFVGFLLLARRYEFNGRRKAAAHLDRLAKVIPTVVARIDQDGNEQQVAIFDIQADDLIRVLPGETVPVDGVLVEGCGLFDESLLTGEAHPVTHNVGDELVAGSLSCDQPILMRALDCADNATPNRLRRLMQQGSRSRPRIARLTDRVASVFVFLVLLLAALTAGYWYWHDSSQALANTIAVLIVTCPCALALATPVALTIGTAQLTRLGIVPLNMDAIEPLAEADIAVFDKTGTLTQGKPTLVGQWVVNDHDNIELLTIAASLADSSTHPLSRALSAANQQTCHTVDQLHHVAGQGLTGIINGQSWSLGEVSYVAESIPADAEYFIEQQASHGRLISCLGSNAKLMQVFAFEDTPRAGITTLIKDLHQSGIQDIQIFSGDRTVAVKQLADETGITSWQAAMSPEDKLRELLTLQDLGHKVMMVGDGINDAPTLAAANVSLSFVSATELAQAHSDFSLLGDDLSVVVQARKLARVIRKVIIQNLSWAAAYNLLAIPAAMAGLIPTWAAAIGMSASSLVVIANSLRLQKN